MLSTQYNTTLSVFKVEKESFNANPQKSGGLYLKKIGSGNRDRNWAWHGPQQGLLCGEKTCITVRK